LERYKLRATGTSRDCIFKILPVSHGLSSESLLEALNCCVFCFFSYGVKKKKIFLGVPPQDLFEPLTAVMKVIPEVFSTSLATDDFVRMVYWIS